jgi:hypothetical protein
MLLVGSALGTYLPLLASLFVVSEEFTTTHPSVINIKPFVDFFSGKIKPMISASIYEQAFLKAKYELLVISKFAFQSALQQLHNPILLAVVFPNALHHCFVPNTGRL